MFPERVVTRMSGSLIETTYNTSMDQNIRVLDSSTRAGIQRQHRTEYKRTENGPLSWKSGFLSTRLVEGLLFFFCYKKEFNLPIWLAYW